MFTGELAESRQTEVVIRDIDERAMELLIDFAYTSQVTAAAAVVVFPTRGWKLIIFSSPSLLFECSLKKYASYHKKSTTNQKYYKIALFSLIMTI